MELPVQQIMEANEQQEVSQSDGPTNWCNSVVSGFYSHGPPQFPGLMQPPFVEKTHGYDENRNLDNCSSNQVATKEQRSSCMFPALDAVSSVSGTKALSDSSRWHKALGSQPSDSELSEVAKSAIDKVLNGKKADGESCSGQDVQTEQSASASEVTGFYAQVKSKKPVEQRPLIVAGGGVIPRKHQCEECTYSTDNRSHLRRHISSVHCTVKQFSCYVCNKEFSRQEKAKIHVVRVHPEVEYDKDKIKKGDLIKALEKSDAAMIEKSRTKVWDESNGVKCELTESDSNEQAATPADAIGGEPHLRPSPPKRTQKSYKDLERRFRCPNCAYIGKDVWHLKRHMNEIHEGLKNFQCNDCHYSTSRKHRMISHMKSHGQLRCFYCSYTSTDVNSFNAHLTECTRLHRAASYPCTVCGEPFGVRKTYAKHMMDSHGLVLYMCDECLFVSLNFSDFCLHRLSHESQGSEKPEVDEGEHFCAPCNELFPSEEMLQQHVEEVHSGKVIPSVPPKEEDSFSCAMCDFRTMYRFVMRNHIRKHTGEKFTCDVPGCDFQAAWKNSIHHHKELKHAPVEDHKCPECNKVFHHKLNLKLHMKIHNKCHTCPVCDHTFAQLSFLNKHLLKHQDHKDNSERKWNDIDGAENVYQCEWDGCLFRSKYRNVLKRHFDSLHQGQKHSVQEEPSVSDEQVEEHTGNTNEKCDRCGKLFAERFELRNHMFDKHDLVLQVESETESESQVA